MPQFAVELNRLCEVKWPGGDRSANNQLADYVSGHTGRTIDRQYIWRIRKGRVVKVDADVRDALCAFFKVPPDHFSRPSRRDLGTEVQEALERTGLQMAGLRASDLSDGVREDLTRLLNEVGRLIDAEKTRESR